MSKPSIKEIRAYIREFAADEIKALMAEARADEARKCCADVCYLCSHVNWEASKRSPETESQFDSLWIHMSKKMAQRAEPCLAAAIHERLHRQATEKGEDRE